MVMFLHPPRTVPYGTGGGGRRGPNSKIPSPGLGSGSIKTTSGGRLAYRKPTAMSDVISPAIERVNPRLVRACRSGNVEAALTALDEGADITNYRPLHVASEYGHANVVKLLLERGANANKATIDTGTTPLHVASTMGHANVVQVLLERGGDANRATTDHGITPLFMASKEGHTNVVRLLLERGADANKARTTDGATPLFMASQNGHIDVVTLLLQHGADADKALTIDGCTPLNMASQEGHIGVVRLLLEHGADADKARTDIGATPLYVASQNGHTDVVMLLLEHGADANKARADDGATPLYVASEYKHTDVVKLLLKHGADADKARADDGATPLFIASYIGISDVVKLLLDHGANDNLRGSNGLTPLFIASQNGHTEVVRLLLERGGDADKATIDDGLTPLYAASWHGHADVVKLLLEHGANANLTGTNDTTPLYVASQNGELDTVKVLLDKGADVNKAARDGNTPLHVAIENHKLEVARVLLEHGADVNRLDPDGRPPLHLAVADGLVAMICLLLEYGARVNEIEAEGENYTALFDLLLFGFTSIDDNDALAITQLLIAAGADTVLKTRSGVRFYVHELTNAQRLTWPRTAEWVELKSTEGFDRAEIIKSLVASPTAIPVTFSLAQSISASEERAARFPRAPAQIEESGRVVDLCKRIRMKWAPVRHGLFHPRYRSTVMCLLMVVRRNKEVFPGAFRSIRTEVPREIWFIIIEQLSREGWPSREALDFTPSRSDALPPPQNGTGISTDFTTAEAVVGIGAPRRAKDSVPDDFEVEYGRAMAGTLSRIGQLLKRSPKDPNLAAARAAALEISGNLDRRIKAKTTAGGSPLVVECARTLLKLETRLSPTERMKLANVCRNLFDAAATAMTKVHIDTGTLPGDYGPEE